MLHKGMQTSEGIISPKNQRGALEGAADAVIRWTADRRGPSSGLRRRVEGRRCPCPRAHAAFQAELGGHIGCCRCVAKVAYDQTRRSSSLSKWRHIAFTGYKRPYSYRSLCPKCSAACKNR